MDSSSSAAALLPRYRRLHSFGDVLDESMSLFRTHWANFALVSAVSLVPPGLVTVWLSASGALYRPVSLADLQSGRLARDAAYIADTNSQLGVTFVVAGVSYLFALLWMPAVIVTTDAYLRGETPSLGRIYRCALGSFVFVFVGTLVYFIGVTLLAMVAALPLIFFAFGAAGVAIGIAWFVLGTLIAIVGLLFWWLNPRTRTTWLKWLIIIAAPFGLPTYFGTRWGLYVPAAVLEPSNPLFSLARSGQLTDRHWFRVAAILAVAVLIVYTVLALLDGLVTGGMYLYEAVAHGTFGLTNVEAVISSAVSFAVRILFGSMAGIVYAVLFIDLRNRREGTDIAERLGQLEMASVATVHG